MKKAASIFSLFCGVSMLAVWGILLATGQVAGFHSRPFEVIFLLGAEFLTAVSLLLGGIGLLTHRNWGLKAELAALGMLLYCTIYSTGVFGQTGNTPAAGFFAVVVLLAAYFSMRFIFKFTEGDIP